MSSDITHYEILGVDKTATPEELQKAYRRMLRQTHPDTGGNAALFRLVQQAWEVLGTPASRADYDRSTNGPSASYSSQSTYDNTPPQEDYAAKQREEERLRQQARQQEEARKRQAAEERKRKEQTKEQQQKQAQEIQEKHDAFLEGRKQKNLGNHYHKLIVLGAPYLTAAKWKIRDVNFVRIMLLVWVAAEVGAYFLMNATTDPGSEVLAGPIYYGGAGTLILGGTVIALWVSHVKRINALQKANGSAKLSYKIARKVVL